MDTKTKMRFRTGKWGRFGETRNCFRTGKWGRIKVKESAVTEKKDVGFFFDVECERPVLSTLAPVLKDGLTRFRQEAQFTLWLKSSAAKPMVILKVTSNDPLIRPLSWPGKIEPQEVKPIRFDGTFPGLQEAYQPEMNVEIDYVFPDELPNAISPDAITIE